MSTFRLDGLSGPLDSCGVKPLKTEFSRGGFEFKQIKRVGDVAIYQQGRPGQKDRFHYEVVRIRRRGEREAFGTTFEAGEYYPNAEEWGVYGWTYGDLVGAEGRLAVLVAAKLEKGVTP